MQCLNLKEAIRVFSEADIDINVIPIRFDEALSAMQQLQQRIDQLEAVVYKNTENDGGHDPCYG